MTDPGLLAHYYAEQRSSLVEMATRLLKGDVMTAEDVVQSAFLRLLAGDRMITAITLPALVRTTMLNLLRDIWRRRQHREELELSSALGDMAVAPDDVLSVCSATQIAELLEYKMAKMDHTVAQITRMNILEGKAVSEISDELGMKYKMVENRLQTGRKQVRSFLRKVV
jgi:RNA polymerase sigma factor (sigma-70 family)